MEYTINTAKEYSTELEGMDLLNAITEKDKPQFVVTGKGGLDRLGDIELPDNVTVSYSPLLESYYRGTFFTKNYCLSSYQFYVFSKGMQVLNVYRVKLEGPDKCPYVHCKFPNCGCDCVID